MRSGGRPVPDDQNHIRSQFRASRSLSEDQIIGIRIFRLKIVAHRQKKLPSARFRITTVRLSTFMHGKIPAGGTRERFRSADPGQIQIGFGPIRGVCLSGNKQCGDPTTASCRHTAGQDAVPGPRASVVRSAFPNAYEIHWRSGDSLNQLRK